jgi:hypothetical protein
MLMDDFEPARRSDDSRSFEVEMESLVEMLVDVSERGGSFVEVAAV